MTTPTMRLHSMTFDDGEPHTVTVALPAETLYFLATLVGRLPTSFLSEEFRPHVTEFYHFVTSGLANRFYEDGLTEAVGSPWHHRYAVVFVTQGLTGERFEPERELLRTHLMEALEDPRVVPRSGSAPSAKDVAEVLASALEAQGWRMPASNRIP